MVFPATAEPATTLITRTPAELLEAGAFTDEPMPDPITVTFVAMSIVIGTPYVIVIVPEVDVPEICVNVISPVFSVRPDLTTAVTGMLPTL